MFANHDGPHRSCNQGIILPVPQRASPGGCLEPEVEHGLDASIAELEASGTELAAAGAKKKAEARALKPKARTAHAAITAEDTAHSNFMVRFNSHSNRMVPPPSPVQG